MIKNIAQLKDIGCFDNISQNCDFKYGENGQNCNIIFGLNGTGKTTISNVLSFFSCDSFLGAKEKEELFNDIKRSISACVELELQGAAKIKYPAAKDHSKNIYVFNSNFISSHVFNGTKGKIKKFSAVSGEIKNKEIVRLTDELNNMEKRVKEIDDEQARFGKELEKITKEKSDEFRKSLTDKGKRLTSPIQKMSSITLPTQSIEYYDLQLERLKKDYELSKKQTELNADIAELKSIRLVPIELDVSSVNEILSVTIQKLSGDVIEQRIRDVQALFEDDQHKQSVERWYKFGGDVLSKRSSTSPNHCPICNTDITDRIGDIIKDFNGFFDKAYDGFISQVDQYIENIKTLLGSLIQYSDDVKKIDNIRIKYAGVTKLDDELILRSKGVERELKTILTVLEKKKSNIQLKEVIDDLKECNTFNESIQKIRGASASMQDILESKTLDTHEIEDEIRESYNSIVIIKFNELDETGALAKYNNNASQLETLRNNEIPSRKSLLAIELAKIKAESKGILKYLKMMGINNFSVDINDDSDENIIIRYNDSFSEKNKLRNCLSEGEKTAVAFAYFLSKFENEVNTEALIKDAITIIDDPISSLDENRLYSTAYLIKNAFDSVKQLVVLSHNFLFLKYFNSFYKGKACCFYLEKNSLAALPEELKNFETPYFFMMKYIQGFVDESNTEIVYNDVKRYLPNYIRRVLETFLSFRFARLSSKRGSGFSPGLDDFEIEIKNTSLDDNLKATLKGLISEIKFSTDQHSHGNAHHTQESFYISEGDLLNLSKKALEIIDILEGQKITLS